MFLKAVDLIRIVKAVEVMDLREMSYAAYACLIMLERLERYNATFDGGDVFTAEPDAITRGLRMLLYRREFDVWRDKHPKDVAAIEKISRDRDFTSMLNYIKESVANLIDLIPY